MFSFDWAINFYHWYCGLYSLRDMESKAKSNKAGWGGGRGDDWFLDSSTCLEHPGLAGHCSRHERAKMSKQSAIRKSIPPSPKSHA